MAMLHDFSTFAAQERRLRACPDKGRDDRSKQECKMIPLKVLVADDHRLFRQGLISLMRTRPDLVQVVGEASTGREAVELTGVLRPDVILMDVYMPEGTGMEAAHVIRHKYPKVAIVMLTSSEQNEHVLEAIRMGAAGYLLKNLDAGELFELLSGVRRGEVAITRTMAARLLRNIGRPVANLEKTEAELTDREIDVLRLVAQGASNPQIAAELCITVNTVKSHLKNILTKLQLENRTQIAAYAVQSGLVAPLEP
jgi:DNA-binding NarL/FixJ family response regulator